MTPEQIAKHKRRILAQIAIEEHKRDTVGPRKEYQAKKRNPRRRVRFDTYNIGEQSCR